MLTSLCVAKAYPPKGDSGLHTLHREICESKMSSHHKLSVFFYLLLDFDEGLGLQGRSSAAESFATRSGVPTKYQIFMRGLWDMDRHQFQVCYQCNRLFDFSIH